MLEALVRRLARGVEVWAYGSLVNGRSQDGCTLDPALQGPSLSKTPLEHWGGLVEAAGASNIPSLVDAHDWTRLPESFHREIERNYVILAVAGEGEEGLRAGTAGQFVESPAGTRSGCPRSTCRK